MTTRINFDQHQKKDTILTTSDWGLKFGEHTAMEKLTTYSHKLKEE